MENHIIEILNKRIVQRLKEELGNSYIDPEGKLQGISGSPDLTEEEKDIYDVLEASSSFSDFIGHFSDVSSAVWGLSKFLLGIYGEALNKGLTYGDVYKDMKQNITYQQLKDLTAIFKDKGIK